MDYLEVIHEETKMKPSSANKVQTEKILKEPASSARNAQESLEDLSGEKKEEESMLEESSAEQDWRKFLALNSSLATSLFYGMQTVSLTCSTCSHSKHKSEPIKYPALIQLPLD